MTDLLLPVGVLGASLGVTYVAYVRPMRRGQRGHQARKTPIEGELDDALQRARRNRLRAASATRAERGIPATQPHRPPAVRNR